MRASCHTGMATTGTTGEAQARHQWDVVAGVSVIANRSATSIWLLPEQTVTVTQLLAQATPSSIYQGLGCQNLSLSAVSSSVLVP